MSTKSKKTNIEMTKIILLTILKVFASIGLLSTVCLMGYTLLLMIAVVVSAIVNNGVEDMDEENKATSERGEIGSPTSASKMLEEIGEKIHEQYRRVQTRELFGTTTMWYTDASLMCNMDAPSMVSNGEINDIERETNSPYYAMCRSCMENFLVTVVQMSDGSLQFFTCSSINTLGGRPVGIDRVEGIEVQTPWFNLNDEILSTSNDNGSPVGVDIRDNSMVYGTNNGIMVKDMVRLPRAFTSTGPTGEKYLRFDAIRYRACLGSVWCDEGKIRTMTSYSIEDETYTFTVAFPLVVVDKKYDY